jgi:hypothetical protein
LYSPNPVLTPQPNRHIFSKGASSQILAQEISARTVYLHTSNEKEQAKEE